METRKRELSETLSFKASGELDSRLEAEAKSQGAGKSDIIREACWLFVDGQNERLDRREDFVEARIEDKMNELERLQEELDDIREMKETGGVDPDIVEEAEEQLFEVVEEGQGNVWPDHPKVRRVAEVKGTSPQKVIDALKNEYPDEPEHRFREP